MTPSVTRVLRRRREIPRTWTLELELVDGERPPSLPGQFNMLYAFGIGEIPVSLSGKPEDRQRLIHTIRAVGPVSEALTTLKAGSSVGVRGPYGAGWPVESAAGCDVLIIGGGLGLAPLRPAFHAIMSKRDHYGKIILLYGTRSPADILYRRELERWRRRLDLQVQVTVDHATSEWRGDVGIVTTLILRASFDPVKSIAFVCGPEIMMRFTAAALVDAGLRDDAVYVSMERNMKCAVGLCGHCQFGPAFVCRDGPVIRYDKIRGILAMQEI